MNLADLDELIADADPARDVVLLSGSSVEAQWRYVQLPRVATGQVQHRRVLFTVGALCAAVLALVLTLVTILASGPPSAAAAVLERAAAAAAGHEATVLRPGQYLYTETYTTNQVTIYEPTASGQMHEVAYAQFDETDQAWTNAASKATAISTGGPIQFSSAADEQAWDKSAMGPSMTKNMTQVAGDGGAYPQSSLLNVSRLPTDPSSLSSVLSNGEMHTNVDLIPQGPDATFERAAALLVGPVSGMTPALASSLFQVMASQPGVVSLGTVQDHDGQQGDAIALPSASATNVSEVIVDPNTGSLLEVQFALPGTTTSSSGGEMCAGPATSDLTCSSPSVGQAIQAPVWTDLVASGVVNSDTATVPSMGTLPSIPSQFPGAPTGLSAVSMNGEVYLSWTPPTYQGASPIIGYAIDTYSPAADGVFDTESTSTHYTTSTTMPTPPTGTRPTGTSKSSTITAFSVQAVNAEGPGPPSARVSVTP